MCEKYTNSITIAILENNKKTSEKLCFSPQIAEISSYLKSLGLHTFPSI